MIPTFLQFIGNGSLFSFKQGKLGNRELNFCPLWLIGQIRELFTNMCCCERSKHKSSLLFDNIRF